MRWISRQIDKQKKEMNTRMYKLPNKQKAAAALAQASDFAPARILEIELGQPLLPISAVDEKTGHHYQRVSCLVRLHTQPLGVVEFQLAKSEVSAYEYTQYIWHTLSGQINEHLLQ